MGGEWHERSLGDLAEIFDGPHATPAKTETGPIFLGISNLVQGRLDLTDTEHLSEEDYVRWTRRIEPRSGDVVFSYETRLGEAARIPPGLRCCLGRRMGLLRPRKGEVDGRFLLYAYLGPQFQETLRSRTIHGSTVDRIPLIDMPRFPIAVPIDLGAQRAIAHILGTLDDKIELNRRMSETLEAMARALFKSWFVDFDPVRAKVEGRDPGLPKPLTDLFPARLVDSEIGEIPEGWRATRWGELVTLEYGKSLGGYDNEAGRYPVYGTNGRIGRYSESLCKHPGIIIGRKGAYRGIHFCSEPFFVIDTAFYVEPRGPTELRWAYYDLLRQDINSMDSGSAIPSTSREDFYSLPVVCPPFDVQEVFARLLKPFWMEQEAKDQESRTLAALRNTLLPKLISGELRVNDAERFVRRSA
jgi:type I restriction enzyme S subunit